MNTWSRILMVLSLAAFALACETESSDPSRCEFDSACDDNNPCTVDRCDAERGLCQNNLMRCDDENLCTQDSCDYATGDCRNLPLDCDDANACTMDSCDVATGECTYAERSCDDKDPCTDDACDPAVGCKNAPKDCSDGSACTVDACQALEDGSFECVYETLNCDDGNPCTDDSCDDDVGACEHLAVDCDDSNACTIDSCNMMTGQCRNVAQDCDDDDLCTVDSCDAATGECASAPADCDDADPCTEDSCNPFSGACANAAKSCNDDDPCTVDACDTDSGDCINSAMVCDDGDLCTVDSCAAGACVFEAMVCNDGDECTIDACVAATGDCAFTERLCDDQNPCTNDACDSFDGDCDNSPIAVDDQDPCTIDSCDPTNGDISHAPKSCDDQDACTIDSCDSVSGACESVPMDCDDDNSCTNDLCSQGSCAHQQKLDGSLCDDGYDFTVDDSCDQGVCAGDSTAAPTVFRIEAVALVSPVVSYDFGAGDIELNPFVSAYATTFLDEFRWGGFVTEIDPMVVDFPGSAVRFGEGACTFDQAAGDIADACALIPWARQSSFATMSWASDAPGCSVGDGELVPAPCFQTPDATFDLGALLPDLFPATVGEITGHVVATLGGDPVTGLEPAYIEAFVPRAVLDELAGDYTLPVNGDEITMAELLSEIPVDMHQGIAGWWITLSFTGRQVETLTLAEGCNLDVSTCDDDDPCTEDLCNPTTGACESPAAANGTACDDGFDATTSDRCVEGLCVGDVTVEPQVFRIDSVSLDGPTVLWDFGEGEVALNDIVSAVITTALDDFDHGGLVAEVDPLAYGYDDVTFRFGEGACTFDAGEADACRLIPWGDQAAFSQVDMKMSESCGTSAAPCFETAQAAFSLSALAPSVFPADVGEVVGLSTGSFTGDPVTGISNGVIEAFVPKAALEAAAAGWSLPVAGDPLTMLDILGPLPTVTYGGEIGWTITLGFTATAVDSLALPDGCNLAPESCVATAACQIASCEPISGACVDGDAVDGSDCSDGFDMTSDDACLAGVCKGVVDVPPTLFRMTTVQVAEPDFAYDFGAGLADVNPILDAVITATLTPSATPESDAILMALVEPLVFDYPYATITLGYGWCDHDQGQVSACRLHPDLPTSTGTVAMYSMSDACSADPAVPAPCFASDVLPQGQFQLDTMTLDCRDIRFVATWDGDPVDALKPGFIEMFLTSSAAAAIEAEVGADTPLPLPDMIADPTVTHDGAAGWWFRLDFEASAAPLAP